MDNRTTEDGITVGELFHLIGKRIWYILGVSVLIALITGLAFAFGLNPKSKTYSLNFIVSYPSTDAMNYPDGSPFYYNDLISAASLEEAKASDPRFQSVDVGMLLKKDDVDISLESQEMINDSRFVGNFTLTVKGSYFSNPTVANDFLRAVAKVPIDRVIRLARETDYTLDEGIFEAASLNDRLELLAELKEDMLAQYDEWISLYRDSYMVEGKTLKNHKADVTVIYSENTQKTFLTELNTYGYVQTENIERQITLLTRERELNNRMIEALQKAIKDQNGETETASGLAKSSQASSDDTDDTVSTQPSVSINSYTEISAQIANLTIRNEQIAYQIENLTEENVEDFEARVKKEYTNLTNAANTMKSITGEIYAQHSTVIYATSKAVAGGTTNAVLAAVAGFIVAFIIASIVFCVIDMTSAKKHAKDGAEQEDEVNDEQSQG